MTRSDGLEIPAFLRRGTPENKRFLAKAAKAVAVVEQKEDPNAWKHAEAARFGLKRGWYSLRWFDDEIWLASMRKQTAEREAAEASRAAERERRAAAVRQERALAGSGNRAARAGARRAAKPRADLPPGGRIMVVNATNPKQEGSDAWTRWNTLLTKCNGLTVEAYAAAGHNTTTLANAVARGNVRVIDDPAGETGTTASGGEQKQPEARSREQPAAKKARKSRGK